MPTIDAKFIRRHWLFERRNGILVPRSLRDRKIVILGGEIPELMRQLRTSVNKRIARGFEEHEGLQSKSKPTKSCLLLTSPANNKRYTVSLSINSVNKWEMSLGVAILLIEGRLTYEQKKGLIDLNWVTSHLCSNWNCATHEHTTVESRAANSLRHTCFANGSCTGPHRPRCLIRMKKGMKKKKKSVWEVSRHLHESSNTVLT